MKKQLERLVAALEARRSAQAPRAGWVPTAHQIATIRSRMWTAFGRSSLIHPAVDAGVGVAREYLSLKSPSPEETEQCNERLCDLWKTLISETGHWHQWARELAWASGRAT
jgi:hypothetical protein